MQRLNLSKVSLSTYLHELDKAIIEGDEFKADVMIERLILLYAGLDEELLTRQATEITKEIKVA